MRLPHDAIFREHPNGLIGPKRTIQIAGFRMENGMTFGANRRIFGVHLHEAKHCDFECEELNGVLVIKDIYK